MLFSPHISNRSRLKAHGLQEYLCIFSWNSISNALLQRVCLLRGTVCVHDRTFNLISSDSGLFQRVFFAQKHDIQQITHSAVGFVFNPGFTLYHSAFPDPINFQSFSISTLSTSLISRFDLVSKRVCWCIIASTFSVLQYRIIFCSSRWRARTDTCAGGLLKSRNASPTVRPAPLL